MQPALFVLRLFPPPPSRADVLRARDGPRAAGAADAREAAVVQRVVGHLPRGDIAPHVLLAPRREGVHLDEPVGRVVLHHLHARAGHGLFPAEPAEPGLVRRERPPERLDLAHEAAAFARRHALAEQVDALLRHHGLDLAAVREEDLHFDPVAPLGFGQHLIGLGEEPPRIQRHERDRPAVPYDDVGDHLVFGRQRRREHQPVAERLPRAAQHRFRVFALKFRPQCVCRHGRPPLSSALRPA